MACLGPDTDTFFGLETLREDFSFLDDPFWMGLMRNLNIREAQIGLAETEWTHVGSGPSDGDWEAVDYTAADPDNPWNTIKVWLDEMLLSCAAHASAVRTEDCKAWRWTNRGDIAGAIAALGLSFSSGHYVIPDYRNVWTEILAVVVDIVENILGEQEFDGWSGVTVEFDYELTSSEREGRTTIQPDGPCTSEVANYTAAGSPCGTYTDRPGYYYVLGFVDTGGKNAFPGIGTGEGEEGITAEQAPEAATECDVFVTHNFCLPTVDDVEGSFTELDDCKGAWSYLVDEESELGYEDVDAYPDLDTTLECPYQWMGDTVPPNLAPDYPKLSLQGWVFSRVCTKEFTISRTGGELAPGVTLTVDWEAEAVAGPGGSLPAGYTVTPDSGSVTFEGEEVEKVVEVVLEITDAGSGYYAWEEIAAEQAERVEPGVRANLEFTLLDVSIDMCVDDCGLLRESI